MASMAGTLDNDGNLSVHIDVDTSETKKLSAFLRTFKTMNKEAARSSEKAAARQKAASTKIGRAWDVGLKKARGALTLFGKALKGITTVMGVLVKIAKKVAMTLAIVVGIQVVAATATLLKLSKAVIKATQSYREFLIVLKGSTGSMGRAREIADFVRELAIRLPVTVEQLQKAVQSASVIPALKLKFLAKDFKDVEKNIRGLAEALVYLSALNPNPSTGGPEGALFAIREALSGQFRSLRQRFDISPQVIAGSIGKTQSDLKKDPSLILPAIQEFGRQNIGAGAIGELSMLPRIMIGNIRASFDEAFRKAGEGGFFDGFVRMLSAAEKKIGKFIREDFVKKGIARQMSDALSRAFKNFTDLGKTLVDEFINVFAPDAGGDRIAGFFVAIGKAVESASNKFEAFVKFLRVAVPMGVSAVSGIGTIVGGALGDLSKGTGADGKAVKSLAGNILLGIFDAVNIAINLIRELVWIVSDILTFIKDVKNKPSDALGSVVDWIVLSKKERADKADLAKPILRSEILRQSYEDSGRTNMSPAEYAERRARYTAIEERTSRSPESSRNITRRIQRERYEAARAKMAGGFRAVDDRFESERKIAEANLAKAKATEQETAEIKRQSDLKQRFNDLTISTRKRQFAYSQELVKPEQLQAMGLAKTDPVGYLAKEVAKSRASSADLLKAIADDQRDMEQALLNLMGEDPTMAGTFRTIQASRKGQKFTNKLLSDTRSNLNLAQLGQVLGTKTKTPREAMRLNQFMRDQFGAAGGGVDLGNVEPGAAGLLTRGFVKRELQGFGYENRDKISALGRVKSGGMPGTHDARQKMNERIAAHKEWIAMLEQVYRKTNLTADSEKARTAIMDETSVIMDDIKSANIELAELLQEQADAAKEAWRQLFESIKSGMENTIGDVLIDGLKNKFRNLTKIVQAAGAAMLKQLIQVSLSKMFAGGGGGGGNLLGGLLGLGAGASGFAGGGGTATTTTGTSLNNLSNDMGNFSNFSGTSGFSFKAKGDPLVSSPTKAIIGEGPVPEAVVPLPDGRTIPVNMRGGGGGEQQPHSTYVMIDPGEMFKQGLRQDPNVVLIEVAKNIEDQGYIREAINNTGGA